ncbi:MAG TPA: DUF1801 domain-containing protein [Xanthomonadales bacterium]|nr:DUF1801 domain-containing protein [Xanthomonadales bacterium]
MSRKQFTTVDEYINSFPKEVGEVLQTLRKAIKEEVPEETVETISYGIPTFKLNGKYVVYFAGYKKHVSIYPLLHAEGVIKKEIAPYIKGRGTLQFQLDKPLPFPLIRKIVKILVKENLERTRKF